MSRPIFTEVYVFGQETVLLIVTDLNEKYRYTVHKITLSGEKPTFILGEGLSLIKARDLVKERTCV